MTDFIEHLLGELKRGRLTREAVRSALVHRSAGRDAVPGPSAVATPAAGLRGMPMLLQECWQAVDGPRRADLAVERVVCVVDPQSHAEIAAAFATTAADLKVVFVPFAGLDDAGEALSAPNGIHDALSAAFAELQTRHGRFDGLIHLPNPAQPTTAGSIECALVVLQALQRAQLPCARMLFCAAHDASVSDSYAEALVAIERTSRVISPEREVAVMIAECIPGTAEALRAHVVRVVSELRGEALRSVRYRADIRHRVGYAQAPAMRRAPRLKRGGTYLISGGCGALGWMFARHLATQYRANVVLVGRSAMAPERMRELEHLLANGLQIVHEPVDVADAERIRDCVERTRARFGAIDGVIHAAGVQGAGTLFEHDITRVREVLRPKIAGTLALEAAMDLCPELSFFSCFSSNSAVLGDFGSFDYAIANRFQMAHMQHAVPGREVLRLAIGWPLWDAGGMGSDGDAEGTRLYLDSSGQQALEPRLGLRLFELMLCGESGFLLLMYGDAERFRVRFGLEAGAAREDAPPAPIRVPQRSAVLRGLDLDQCVAVELTAQIAEMLKLSPERILPRRNLTEFGFDSILLARWARQISSHFAIEFTPAVFFSHPTLRQVVEHLVETHRDALRAFYSDVVDAGASAVRGDSGRSSAPDRVRDAEASAATHGIGSATAAAAGEETARGAEQAPTDDAIAIVGMSGRFPAAGDIDALWRILSEGRDAISEIPLDRFDWRPLYDAADGTPRMVSKWLGVAPAIDEFDPLFFEMSPRDAQNTDPRQRLLLQEAWHALEDAGYGDDQLQRDRIGAFVGVEQGEYQLLAGPHSTLTGNHEAILASRLSYTLDLHGPAMAINTSCSSGLVAAHQACLSLRANECDAAIAAAVNLVLTPHPYIGMSAAGMLSATGRCHVFDERADGMVPGEAVVAFVFKRLSRAQADGDPIHAVIAASGINYDGKTNGITAPNGAAQSRLIEETYVRAGIAPGDIEYVVAHGTATRLGDPVEVTALDRVFGNAGRRQFCALTSTKSNLGHTFAASGLVSLASLVLALRHDTIPASLHCERPSDYIDWPRSAFYVNRARKPWPRQAAKPRHGAVSAFGMSGTNAHMVVRDAPATASARSPDAPCRLLAVSATTEAALRQRMADLLALLRDDASGALSLASVSHTLLVHRSHFVHRCAVIAEDLGQAVSLLEAAIDGQSSPAIVRGKVPADFEARPVLTEYVDGLVRGLPALSSNPASYRDTLGVLADFYVQGYRPDWKALYAGHPPTRIRLPAYPFARQRYWCANPSAAHADARSQTSVVEHAPQADSDAPQGLVQAGVQYLAPVWEVVETGQLVASPTAAFPMPSDRPLVIGGGVLARNAVKSAYPRATFADIDDPADSAALDTVLDTTGDFDHVVYIVPQTQVEDDVQLLPAQRDGVLALFRFAKALLARGHGDRPLAWTVVTFRAQEVHRGGAFEPVHSGVHGLTGSLAKEYPQWSIRQLDLNSDADWQGSGWALVPADPRARPWACRFERWHRQQLISVRARQVQGASPALPRGAYVVVGGAGHVGAIWTEHVVRTTCSQVVWIGRRPLDAGIQASIDRIAAHGPAPHYVVADAADPASLAEARREIVERFGRVDGLVLSSIHLDPRPLLDMDEAHLHAALRAKLDVNVRAVEAFARDDLKWLVFFSSVISFIRNPLQSGYAAACTFSDVYARALRQRFSERGGPKVKIMNWGFWDRVENLQLDGFSKMAQMGIGLIRPEEGMAAFDDLLAMPLDQMGVVRTTKPTLVEGMSPRSVLELQSASGSPDMADLQQRVRDAVARQATKFAQRSIT